MNPGFRLPASGFRLGVAAALLVAQAASAEERLVAAAKALQLKQAPKEVQVDKAAPAKVKAPTSQDDVARDAATDKKRDELISDLQKIIPRIPEGAQKADLYFQLAELWWEKSRYTALQESKEFDDAYAAWLARTEQKGLKEAGPEPKLTAPKSEAYRKEARKVYQTILDKYPTYPRRDEVLFVVGYNLYESGDKQQALAHYTTLLKTFPGSRFVPDTYVQVGEHYFASNDLAHARAAFEKAAASKQPKIYSFALYKLAWCDYNAGDYQGAIDKFHQVIAYSEQSATSSKDRVQLKSEALKDLVLAYAQVDAIEDAAAYFKEKAGPEAGLDLVNKLAATYFETGKFDQAIHVYKQLEAEAPAHVRAPAWQQKVLLAYDKLGKRDRVIGEMKVLVDSYGPKSAWAKANAGEKGALAEAEELSESALRELVQDYHQEAIKTKSVATYKLARDIYAQHLATFPTAESAYNLRFYYAEILYALEDWDAAARQYAQVVELDPKGTYAQRAAYDTILALEKQAQIANGVKKKSELADAARIDERKAKGQVEQKRAIRAEKISKDTAEEPIPELEQRLVAACEKYLEVSPKAKDEIVLRYKAAFIFYDHRHYVEAARRFGEIILKWPADEFSRKAAELSMNILEVKEEWEPLSELAHRFLQDKRIAPPGSQFAKDLARIGEGARFKYVMDIYEKRKDDVLAARLFGEFVKTYPKSENAVLALNNQLVIAEKAEQLDLVIEAAEAILKQHAKDNEEITKTAMLSLGAAYERAARYPEAANAYVAFADKYPQDPKAADQLFDAALWKEGLGDDAGALALWQRYLKAYGARPDAAKIAFNVGLLLQRQKEWKKAVEHWSGFAQRYGASATPGQLLLARYNEGLALREVRKDDPAVASAMSDVSRRFAGLPEAEKQGPVLDAAAHAKFLLVEPAFDDFVKIHFNYTRQRELVSVLKVKNTRMARLQDAYKGVIQVGSPLYTQAALTRLGEAYRDFNKKLLDAPMPRGLDPEQQDLYRTTLENQALPLEDKAVEAFEKALETASRTGSYSEWVLKAQERLKDYKPDAFGEVHKVAPSGSEPLVSVAPDVVAQAGGAR